MPLPEKYHSKIQERKGTYFIYFKNRSNMEHCGYAGKTKEEIIEKCDLKALDKFKTKPIDWDELEVVPILV